MLRAEVVSKTLSAGSPSKKTLSVGSKNVNEDKDSQNFQKSK